RPASSTGNASSRRARERPKGALNAPDAHRRAPPKAAPARGQSGGARQRTPCQPTRSHEMTTTRTDDEMLAKLIERSRLLIALSDEIPTETKLQTQPLLKQLEVLLADSDRDLGRIEGTHALLRRELADYADLDALLGAMENFLPR